MKYKLGEEKEINGIKMFHVVALKDFAGVKAGDVGGFIEKEENLSQYGDALVGGDARVHDNAMVYGNARVCGNDVIKSSKEILNILNLKYNLTITPQNIVGGCRSFTHEEFENLTLEKCNDKTWTENELKAYKMAFELWKLNQL